MPELQTKRCVVQCGYDLKTFLKHKQYEWFGGTTPHLAASSSDYTSAVASMQTDRQGPKGTKKMTVMHPDLYALQPYKDLYDRCVQRWKTQKGTTAPFCVGHFQRCF